MSLTTFRTIIREVEYEPNGCRRRIPLPEIPRLRREAALSRTSISARMAKTRRSPKLGPSAAESRISVSAGKASRGGAEDALSVSVT